MDLLYTVVRSSRRKKLTITVERDKSVVVHAPQTAADEAIAKVVQAKRQWIIEKINHPQKYQDLPHPPGKEMVNGESALYLGQNYLISIGATSSGKIEFSRQFRIPPTDMAQQKVLLKDWYRARAEDTILPRAHGLAQELGVHAIAVNIVDNRFRWGSCTTKDHVNFNWRLIKAPMFVIDYVIVHELAHLLESNHTARFWNIVRAKVPLAEKARQWLKEHGQLLEEEI